MRKPIENDGANQKIKQKNVKTATLIVKKV